MAILYVGRSDEARIASDIYDAVRGEGFSVWNENYPVYEDALADAKAGCLFLLREGEIALAVASVEPVAEDDDLPFFRICDGSHREISRVAVAPKFQGKGYAKEIMEKLISHLKDGGVRSIHLLCAKQNLPAMAVYKALGFDFIGECHRYGADYYVCEKLI